MKRIAALDIFRGFAFLNMLAYHACYDLYYLCGLKLTWFTALPAYVWQQGIVSAFVLASGAASIYARSPLRRGLLLCLGGFFLTIVTFLFVPQELIVFGVLSFLGIAMFLTSLVRTRMPSVRWGIPLCILGFLLTEGWQRGYWGCYGWKLSVLPASWLEHYWLFPLGLRGKNFFSADYVPLFPWIFMFWLGFYLWKLLLPIAATWRNIPSLAFLGRHTLVLYFLHQPLLIGVLKYFFLDK